MDNPYQASHSNTPASPSPETVRIASAQKLVIYAILCYLGTLIGQILLGPAALFLLLAAVVLSFVGSIRLARCFGYGVAATILFILGLFIPLLGLILLLRLNSKATEHLKQAGYKVGLLGASLPT